MTGLFGALFAAFLLFSIALHELGHLLTAKATGMKVHQYFVGFGPRIWSMRRGETEYGVRALPLGGFVKIAGMNPYEEIAPEDRDRVYKAKKPWQRAIVLSAGSFTHFVLAFVILVAVFASTSRPDFDRPTTTIAAVTQEVEGEPSPAVDAGMAIGDRIVAVQGQRVQTWDQVVEILRDRPGLRTRITVVREDERTVLTARLTEHPDRPGEQIGFLGVGPAYEERTYSLVGAGGESARLVARGTVESLRGLRDIFTPRRLGEILGQLAGTQERGVESPTTIVGLTGTAGQFGRTGDFASLFLLVALFNIFIGVVNMLPLPPLDGGHLAVLTYEKVRRREVDVRKLIPITTTVILIFGTLFLMLLVLDITQPISLPQ